MKKVLALILATVICFSMVGVIPAKAATEKTTDIGWFGNQNGNPWNGSNWSFLTGKDGNFEKMTNYIANDSATASLKPGWSADENAETAFISSWRQQATQEKWAVTAFDIVEDGNIMGTSGQTLKIEGAGSGEVIVVVKSTNGFYPVWPSKGEWTWQTVADKAGISVDFTIGYKSGDTLYYIVKPSEGVELTCLTICPKVTFTGGTATDYPTAFTAFGGNPEVPVEEPTDIGWFAKQNQQPWPGSHWTFEYLDKTSMEFSKMETYVSDAAPCYWQDATGKVQIKSWQQVSCYDKYAAVAYHATKRGKLDLTSTTGTIKAGSVGGQFMLLQKSGTQYHVLLNWVDIPANQEVKIPQTETFVEAEDIVYFLYRSANVLYVTSQVIVNYTPKVIYTAETGSLYPTEWTDLSTAVIGSQEELNAALNKVPITYNPTDAKYQDGNRLYQGVPSIVKEDKTGRLWATWMTGGFTEDEYNWAPIYTSDDDGKTWSGPKFVIDPETPVRAFEQNLWIDPEGRMWYFWSQSYYWFDGRCGVWAMYTENPEAENPTWSEPVRIADGVARNKPTVLSNGDWILPTALWAWSQVAELDEFKHANVYVSKNKGETWGYLGSVKEYEGGANHDENMVIEQNDGSLRMLIRTTIGIEESYSYDDGKTWTNSVDANITKTVSRFYIGRLSSGNQLLVYHDPDTPGVRSHLVAAISEDDGQTWKYKLMIDERVGVSYPDVQQDKDGNIYIIYDDGRTSKSKILFAKITEEDIKAGKLVTETSKLQVIINDNTAEIATVVSESGGISAIAADGRIFNDSEYTFAGIIHEWFVGKAYLKASLENGFTARVQTNGWVYVLTPVAGSANSQQAVLEGYGFEHIIDVKPYIISSDIDVPMALMTKQVAAGEEIVCDGWSILIQELTDDLIEERYTDITWYAKQNVQPWTGSNWTFEYFDTDTKKFKQLETYIVDENYAHWTDIIGSVFIKGWEQIATDKKYTAVTFNAFEKGTIRVTSNTTVIAEDSEGELSIVQKSGGKYHVLMDWMRISTEEDVPLPDVATYVKAGDAIYYVYRSVTEKSSVIKMKPSAYYRKGVEDAEHQYPTEWIDKFVDTDTDKFTGMTLSLDGAIGFNFYVSKDNTLSSDAYVIFTLPNGIQKVSIADAVETEKGLKFTCSVPAKEMGDMVVAALYNDGTAIDTQSVSIRDYAEIILKNEANLEAYTVAGPLIKSMLNYGAYAQRLFAYRINDLANKNYAEEDTVASVGISQLAGFAKGRQELEGFGSLAGASLVLKSETTLKLFFVFTDDVAPEDLTFTISGVTQGYIRSGNYYVVDIPNISANNLDRDYTVTVTAGDKTFDASSSVLTFCYNALKSTDNTTLKDVAKALYLYNKEANTYFHSTIQPM